MHDAVRLDEVLIGACPDVLFVALVNVEAADVGDMRIDHAWVAVGHPLGNDLCHTRAFLDPNRSSRPQVVDFDRLAQARHRVWGKTQETIDGVLDLGVAEKIHQLDRGFHLRIEVVLGEGHLRWGERCFFV